MMKKTYSHGILFSSCQTIDTNPPSTEQAKRLLPVPQREPYQPVSHPVQVLRFIPIYSIDYVFFKVKMNFAISDVAVS
jgi:hypothetical protein